MSRPRITKPQEGQSMRHPASVRHRHRGGTDRHQRRIAAAATRLVRDLDEMGRAAVETIAHRSAVIANAMQDPRKLTDPELSLMLTEKVEAVAATTAVLAPQLMAMPGLYATRWFGDQGALVARSAGQLACDPTVAGAVRQWQRAAEGMALINAAYATAMLGTMVELSAAALAPQSTRRPRPTRGGCASSRKRERARREARPSRPSPVGGLRPPFSCASGPRASTTSQAYRPE